ncbi:DUF58 domain-containing protein [Roseobacter weihaiensis]|uniref:DUF58 domain-containing protein n=1 Tax=Roseobacter weihaiensis TaxID=2763262 RepID=UPI001D0BC593|nr:DUF58 domain-containing protein [Roseobacter sp. H9]
MLALVALAFTVLAAVWGGVGYDLALAGWAVLALTGIADLALSMRRRTDLTYHAPAEVFIGEKLVLHLSDPAMRLEQRARFDWPAGLDGPDDVAFSDDGSASVEVLATRRGHWELGHLWLFWPSRLRLFEFVPKVSLGAEIRVVPNIRLIQSGALTTRVVSALFGVKENRAIGDGSEFHQLRDFTAGMDVKTIDWKRSARKRTLVAKELRAERNHHVILAIDNGYLMREEIAGLPKIDHAVTAALAVAWAADVGGDLVGHYAYDVRPRSFAKPQAGRAAFVRLRSWAAELDYVSRETNHTLALTELNARTPKRSLIIIFTDFVDTTSAELMLENIGILAKRHLILFVAIRDQDVEGRVETAPTDMTGVATLVAANQSISERRLVLERLTHLGVTVIDAKPGQVTGRLISAYLDIKERELI